PDPDSPVPATERMSASDPRPKPPPRRQFLPRLPTPLRPRRRSSSGSAPLRRPCESPLPPSSLSRQARAKTRQAHLSERSLSPPDAGPPPRATAAPPSNLPTTDPGSRRKCLVPQLPHAAIPSQRTPPQNPPQPSDPIAAGLAFPSYRGAAPRGR